MEKKQPSLNLKIAIILENKNSRFLVRAKIKIDFESINKQKMDKFESHLGALRPVRGRMEVLCTRFWIIIENL